MGQGALDRFFKLSIPEPNTGCWLWTGGLGNSGYAVFSVNGRKRIGAHRFAYEQFVGPIPEGLTLDHRCNVRCCVNPEHLRPMTQAENNRRYTQSVTHCPRGHEYSADNTRYGNVKGYRGRFCIACARIVSKQQYLKRKAAKVL